jgi:hypothetical protein
MYLNSRELYPEKLWQGDILENFPFFVFDNFNNLADNDSIPGKVRLSKVIILSQTCDIQERESIMIAPIYEINIAETPSGLLSDLRSRKRNYLFYLPKLEMRNETSFENETIINESFVDFQTIYYVKKDTIQNYKPNRVACMSDWGRHHLASALSIFFGRPIKDKYS